MTLDPTNLTMESVKPIMAPKVMRLKYVILDVNDIPTPIIFPAHLPHDTMVPRALTYIIRDRPFCEPLYEVISAGFCEIEIDWDIGSTHAFPEIAVKVSGGSINLQKSARAEDAELIERALR